MYDLKNVRKNLIDNLWEEFKIRNEDSSAIYEFLFNLSNTKPIFDHFAIMDLPGINSGIENLFQVFSCLGYISLGRDAILEKQNNFMWLTEHDSLGKIANEVLPQAVIADFVLSELPVEISKIILKYSSFSIKPKLELFQCLCGKSYLGDKKSSEELLKLVHDYFRKDWPLPTVKEYKTIQEFNELLSWVLVFGRIPNHFTININLLNIFSSLNEFVNVFQKQLGIELNLHPNIIKGSLNDRLEQCSTKGRLQKVQLADGEVVIPGQFIEFIWRYPLVKNPVLWEEYFTGLITKSASSVIESVYL